MECTLVEEKEALPEKEINTIRDTIHSVGIDQRLNLKERIAYVHGTDSEVMTAVKELDEFLSRPDPTQYAAAMELRDNAENILNQSTEKTEHTKAKRMLDRSNKLLAFENRPEVRRFIGSVSRRIRCPRMSGEVATAMINEGYIVALRRLTYPGAQKDVVWAKQYAGDHEMTLAATLLFGCGGSVYHALIDWIVQEKAHGMHRPGRKPGPKWRQETQDAWRNANKTCNWPIVLNKSQEKVPYDMAVDEAHLPEGVVTKLQERWRCNPALCNYAGTNRLSGDTPYKIIEDVMVMMMRSEFSHLNRTQRYRYDYINKEAIKKGIDPFWAGYRNLFSDKDALRPYWDKARRLLYDYSILLWEARNEIWLAEKKRRPASGVVYKPKKTVKKQTSPKKIPGTIFLNNGRYYWVVANKMKLRPLIDPKSKPKFPGTIFKNGPRYYWVIAGWLKRQRLVPKGEKFSTNDRATAEKIAYRKWMELKKENPDLAAKIFQHTRSQGLATKDRAVAEKVCARMWKGIKKNNPELAVKILQDNRPEARDHWHALIKANGELRFIGSYDTRSEAEAAYAAEFQRTHGYPAGYNVQCIPKLDKVWPTWEEEKARLESMNEQPRMPVIGKTAQIEPLKPIIKRMQRVDWLVENCMLVLNDNCPVASQNVAIQSRGENWYAEIKKQGKRTLINGSTSIDKDSRRIKITVYGQGFGEGRVLTEEIYHIVFEIIRHASPKTFATIEKWYSDRLKKGLDPTWMIHEAFAELMVQEGEFPRSTDLPRRVVNYAQRIFSKRNIVPKWAMKRVLAEV